MIQDYYVPLALIEKRTVSDGEGGFNQEYVEAVEFLGAITTDNSTEMRIAEQQGVKSLYTLTMDLNMPISYDNIVKRKSDGRYFRITSLPEDMESPQKGMLFFKQVTAERFELPII